MFAVVFIIIARDKGIGAAPPRRMLFDWEPIDREEPASSDYGDNANFYVTPTQGPYNNSTVSALFRLHPLPGGFVTTWRSFCVARNDDGTERWRVNGWGKHLDVSPDGTRVALTQEGGGSVAHGDARSGQLLHTTEPLAKHLSQLAWSADGQRIVVLTSGEILRVDAQRGTLLNRFTELPGGENPVLTSVVRSPDGRFIVSHPNAKLLLVLDETTGEITAVEEKFAGNLFLGPSGKFLWIGQTSGVYTDTLPDLAEAGWFKMPGKLGIRAADQQDDFAYIQFQPIPRAALDDKVVLLNDRTGQLWLTSGGKGVAYHTWPREVLDGVEDTLWVGEDVFLVATNDRHIRRMSFYSYQPEWEVKDG